MDNDGDYFVLVQTYPERGSCIFGIGAQITPYLHLVEQKGLGCNFALTRRESASSSGAKTFVYTISTTKEGEKATNCGSPSFHPTDPCPQPEQPKELKEPTPAVQLQEAAKDECSSTTSCFKVELDWKTKIAGTVFQNATDMPSGSNYGVDVKMAEDGTGLFASITDDDGDYFMLVQTYPMRGSCIIGIGAQITPYIHLVEQKGLGCKLTLARSSESSSSSGAKTFAYTVSTTKEGEKEADCGSPSFHPTNPCPQPEQPPKVIEDVGLVVV